MKKELNMAMITIASTRQHRAARSVAICCSAVAVLAIVLLSDAASALAADQPAWSVSSQAMPSSFAPGDTSSRNHDQYYLTAYNIGGAAASGTVTITDTLPAGVTLAASGASQGLGNWAGELQNFSCNSVGQTVTCSGQTESWGVQPGEKAIVTVPVDVSPSASGTVVNQVGVSGAGAPAASSSEQTPIAAASPSGPNFGFPTGGFSASITNADGTPDTQAGSHPYEVNINMEFNTWKPPTQGQIVGADGSAHDINVSLPPGLAVNPQAVPQCTEAELESQAGGGCPADTAIGTIDGESFFFNGFPNTAPLFNMVPPSGVAASFGADVDGLGTYIHLLGGVQTGTYQMYSSTPDIEAREPILGVQVTLWGDPTDPSHDYMRGACANSPQSGTPCSSPEQLSVPFLTLPSACSGPLTFSVQADSWGHPGSFASDTARTDDGSGGPVGVSGCDLEEFAPSVSVQPTTTVADSPSGLDVDLSVPQPESLSLLAEANLKDASVTLPAGMSVNPASADGLQACTPAEVGLDRTSAPACPDGSKIGSVQITTPLLSDPLTGGVYIAEPHNNPFNSLLAIYATAEADGVFIKLAGAVTANPITGQLETTFQNNPQLAFSDFQLDFFSGPRAALATPESCGTFSTGGVFAPWSGNPASDLSDSFQINSGCVDGFSPSFAAGTTNDQAGAYSPFELSFSRSDQDQELSGLTTALPEGMLASLASVSECSDAQIAAAKANTGAAEQATSSCPASSQVGTVETWAGAGSDPLSLPGKLYLTGPYEGAPYGLVVVVPAVAGPYDLGTVVVRQALQIDPTTAQATAVSDPFPTILDGIPLRVRRIDVDLNRPSFTINATSCDPMSVTGTLTSTQGTRAAVSSRYQAAGCASLGFAPKLRIALSGKGKTRSGDHPTLTATLNQGAGQANIRSAKVTLPLSLALDPANSRDVCGYQVAQAVHGGAVGCPASTIVGSASVTTPLLSEPLLGKVYLVQGVRFSNGHQFATLPTLLIPLRGQIALDLRAKSSVSGGKLVTTFPTIPDAPVSKFTLQINGGRKGILVITGRGRSICGKRQMTDTNFGAQSGRAMTSQIKTATPCAKQKAHKRHHKHARTR